MNLLLSPNVHEDARKIPVTVLRIFYDRVWLIRKPNSPRTDKHGYTVMVKYISGLLSIPPNQ